MNSKWHFVFKQLIMYSTWYKKGELQPLQPPSSICVLFCPRLKHFVFVDCRIYNTKRNTCAVSRQIRLYIYNDFHTVSIDQDQMNCDLMYLDQLMYMYFHLSFCYEHNPLVHVYISNNLRGCVLDPRVSSLGF